MSPLTGTTHDGAGGEAAREQAGETVGRLVADMQSQGLKVLLRNDMDQWAAFLSGAPHTDGVNPSFHPAFSKVHRGNSFWLSVHDDTAESPVACIAHRVFRTDDFVSLISSYRLWYESPDPAIGRLPVLHRQAPSLSGSVGHSGGLWIHPGHRRRGIPRMLMGLVRGISVINHAISYETGIFFEKINQRSSLCAQYGYSRKALCVDSYFPPTGRHERIYLNWIPRSDILRSFSPVFRARP
jgi:GNAT superfamily N-acetyltransferase